MENGIQGTGKGQAKGSNGRKNKKAEKESEAPTAAPGEKRAGGTGTEPDGGAVRPERACGTDAGAGTAAAKRPARADKAKFGEFENVLLDGREHGKLVDSLGDTGASEYIERLSVYLAQTGRCYKSHYAAILNWWRRDGMPVRRSPAPRVLKPDVGREITPDMTAEELF